jgi:hypothetical protein
MIEKIGKSALILANILHFMKIFVRLSRDDNKNNGRRT